MTTVYPISSAMPSSQTSTTSSTTDASGGDNTLNEDTFLQLLVAQLKYQDPMNPADSTQFLTQTAQFTEVETLQNMEKLDQTSQAANQLLAAASMVGRPVTYSLATLGGSGTPTPTSTVSVRGTLPDDAATGATAVAATDVYTASGAKVALQLQFAKTDSGWTVQAINNGTKLGDPVSIPFDSSDHASNDVTIPSSALDGIVGTAGDWPATGITLGFGSAGDSTRLQIASGPASVAVTEQDGNDGQSATGVVTGVHVTSDGPQLAIGGQLIPYTSITDVSS